MRSSCTILKIELVSKNESNNKSKSFKLLKFYLLFHIFNLDGVCDSVFREKGNKSLHLGWSSHNVGGSKTVWRCPEVVFIAEIKSPQRFQLTLGSR